MSIAFTVETHIYSPSFDCMYSMAEFSDIYPPEI